MGFEINNVLVSEKRGYIIDFGKECDSSFRPSKKYPVHYPHLVPEALDDSPFSIASDIFPLVKLCLK